MQNTPKRIVSLILLVAALVMQILPYGAVCCYGHEDGHISVVTYSFFDLIPFGYANFAPLLCGIATAVWFVTALLSLLLKKAWSTGRTVLGYSAFILALAPVALGPTYMNLWGWGITVLLCAALFLTKPPHVTKKNRL